MQDPQEQPEQLELFSRPTALTVRDAIALYWEIEGRFLPSGTHKYDIKRLTAFFADRFVHSLTFVDIENYRRWRKMDNPEIRDSTINREHTRITRVLNALKEWKRQGKVGAYDFSALQLPVDNPGELVKKPSERHYKRNRVVTPAEFAKFLDYAHPEVRKICLLAVLTLLRRKDIRLLSTDNFNRALQTLSGVQSKTGLPYNVPAPLTVRIFFAGSEEKRYICDFTNWRRRFKRARVESGVYFQFRDLRRSAATQLLLDGTDIRTIQKMLGHGAISTTEVYLDPPAPVAREAAAKLEKRYVESAAAVAVEFNEN